MRSWKFYSVIPVLFVTLTFSSCSEESESPLTPQASEDPVSPSNYYGSFKVESVRHNSQDVSSEFALTFITLEQSGAMIIRKGRQEFIGTWEYDKRENKLNFVVDPSQTPDEIAPLLNSWRIIDETGSKISLTGSKVANERVLILVRET